LRDRANGDDTVNLTDFQAISFDCYGTLIDWEVGILHVLHPWAESHNLCLKGDELLRMFSEFEPQVQAAHPKALYCDILRMVFQRIAAQLGMEIDDDTCDRFAASIGHWPAFPDTIDALKRLGGRYKLIIVSNVDRVSFRKTQDLLGVGFDAIVTAQDVGVYKPDPRMLEAGIHAAHQLGVERDQLLHTAQSLYHDHVPAKKLGLATCYIDRHAGKGGGAARAPDIDVTTDFTFTTLGQMADAVEAATAGAS
jgi:2-haloalkanoic acid dehalogenase type II